MPDSVLSDLCKPTHLTHIIIREVRTSITSFLDEETEVERGSVTCPGSHTAGKCQCQDLSMGIQCSERLGCTAHGISRRVWLEKCRNQCEQGGSGGGRQLLEELGNRRVYRRVGVVVHDMAR